MRVVTKCASCISMRAARASLCEARAPYETHTPRYNSRASLALMKLVRQTVKLVRQIVKLVRPAKPVSFTAVWLSQNQLKEHLPLQPCEARASYCEARAPGYQIDLWGSSAGHARHTEPLN